MDTNVDTRLARLERQILWIKRGSLVLVSALACMLLVAQSPPEGKLVKAERLVLTNKAGAMRAELKTDDKGAYLLMYHDNGKIGTALSLKGGAGGLVMLNSDGQPRLLLTARDDGSLLYLFDEKRLATSQLGAIQGSSVLRFDCKDYKAPPVLLRSQAEGTTTLDVAGSDGVVRAKLGFEKNGPAVFEVTDATGKTTGRIPAD